MIHILPYSLGKLRKKRRITGSHKDLALI